MDFNLSNFLTPELTAIIITALVVPIIKGVAKYVTTYINVKIDELQERIKQDRINDYIDKAEDIISSVVDSVSQTYVDVLKKQGNFNDEAREEAFYRAKTQITEILTEEGINLIGCAYGDFELWLNNKIETNVKVNKQLDN